MTYQKSSVDSDSFGISVYGSYADYQGDDPLAKSESATESGDQYVCTVKTPLEAGTTVYIKLVNSTDSEVDAAISSKKLAIALSDTPSELTLQTYDDYSWVKFTAPADGTYQLKAASDESMTYSTLYGVYFYGYKNHVTGDEDWDECPSYSTLRKSVSLSKGETIFVKISNNYSSYEQTVYVSCSKSGGGL